MIDLAAVLLDATPSADSVVHYAIDGLLGVVAFFSIRSISKLDDLAKEHHALELAHADLVGKLGLANQAIATLERGVAKESTLDARSNKQDTYLRETLSEVARLREDLLDMNQRKISRGEFPAANVPHAPHAGSGSDSRRDPSDPPDPPPMRPRAGSFGRPMR